MKYILYLSVIVALFSACSQDAFETSNVTSNEGNLSFDIKDKGFVSQESPTTRTVTDNNLITHFTHGDEAGLYIVRDGKVIAANIKLTAKKVYKKDSLTWTSEKAISYNSKDSYYLYTPYRSSPVEGPGIGDVFDPKSENNKDSLFFASMIKAWELDSISINNYYDIENNLSRRYRANDLMTGIGIVNGKTSNGGNALSVFMTHRMAAVLLQFPPTIYKFTDKEIPDYTTDSVSLSNNYNYSYGRVSITGLRYLLLIRPLDTRNINDSYSDFSGYGTYNFTFTVQNILSGTYKTYKIDKAKPIIRSYSLQVGDYFCTTKDKSDWFIKPKNEPLAMKDSCVGIVTYVGEKPIADNYGLLKNEQFKGNKIHGIVTSIVYDRDSYPKVYQADAGKSIWSSFTGQTNISEAWLKNSTWTGNKQRPNSFISLEDTTKYQGYANTLALEEYNKQYDPIDGSKYVNALDSLNKFRTQYHYKVPSNTSGWYLPSIKELNGSDKIIPSKMDAFKYDWYYNRGTYYYIWSSSESKYSTFSYSKLDAVYDHNSSHSTPWSDYIHDWSVDSYERTRVLHVWPMLVF